MILQSIIASIKQSLVGGNILTSGAVNKFESGALLAQPYIFSLNDTQVMVIWKGANNWTYAVVLTISGTDVVAGPTTTIYNVGSGTNYYSGVALTPTTVVATYVNSSTVGTAVVLTVSGTSISVGSTTALNGIFYHDIDRLSDTTAIFTAKGSNNRICAQVITVSGTTCSAGTSLTTITATASNFTSVTALSATQAICVWCDNLLSTKVRVLTISGTTVTSATAAVEIFAGNGTYLTIRKLNSTDVLCSYQSTVSLVYTCRIALIRISSNNPSVVTDVQTVSASLSASNVSMSVKSPTQAIIAALNSTPTGAYATIVNISNNTITLGIPLNVSASNSPMSIGNINTNNAVYTYNAFTGINSKILTNA